MTAEARQHCSNDTVADTATGAVRCPDRPESHVPPNARRLHKRASARLEGGDALGAIAEFDAALQSAPGFAPALSGRSAARLALGDIDGADADATAAVRAGITAETLAGLGAVHQKKKEYAAALAAYDPAVELNPGLVWVYVLRARTRYHLGDQDGARADYQRAFGLDPRVSGWVTLRSIRRAAETDRGGELRACAGHLEHFPADPFTRIRRGLLLVLLGRAAEGSADLVAFRMAEPWAVPHLERLVADAERHRSDQPHTRTVASEPQRHDTSAAQAPRLDSDMGRTSWTDGVFVG